MYESDAVVTVDEAAEYEKELAKGREWAAMKLPITVDEGQPVNWANFTQVVKDFSPLWLIMGVVVAAGIAGYVMLRVSGTA